MDAGTKSKKSSQPIYDLGNLRTAIISAVRVRTGLHLGLEAALAVVNLQPGTLVPTCAVSELGGSALCSPEPIKHDGPTETPLYVLAEAIVDSVALREGRVLLVDGSKRKTGVASYLESGTVMAGGEQKLTAEPRLLHGC
jgi:hypothetical protein